MIRTPLPHRPRLAAYALFTAVGLVFALGSFAYDWTTEDGTVGPAVLPRVAGTLLVLVGALLVRQELRGGTEVEADGDAALLDGAPTAPARPHRMPVVLATMWVAAALIPFLGVLPALTLMMLFLLAVVERIPLPRAVLIAAVTGVGAYLIFVVLLRVPLPLGLLDPALWSAP